MKFALIVGHNERARGACSPHIDGCEFDYNKPLLESVADQINKKCDHTARVFLRDPDAGWELKDVARRVNEWGADACLSGHYNAVATPEATGSEVLYWHTSEGGQAFAEMLLMGMKQTLSLPLRGLKPIDPVDNDNRSDDRGQILSMTAMPHVLAEPFFGSNPNDAKVGVENKDALAGAYADALVQFAER